ncbi:hypothetical protein BE21_37845 [Sorangium cellulosum]|uniref:Uncharacterized protein n=1 Tax=Sorangium cellulosum TaxID=56 RepID=A0A150TN77_SORCE|nr:hypothetical protein BE21_37845 [Sorangium cellulosum]
MRAERLRGITLGLSTSTFQVPLEAHVGLQPALLRDDPELAIGTPAPRSSPCFSLISSASAWNARCPHVRSAVRTRSA